jgi:hypothetical protein
MHVSFVPLNMKYIHCVSYTRFAVLEEVLSVYKLSVASSDFGCSALQTKIKFLTYHFASTVTGCH